MIEQFTFLAHRFGTSHPYMRRTTIESFGNRCELIASFSPQVPFQIRYLFIDGDLDYAFVTGLQVGQSVVALAGMSEIPAKMFKVEGLAARMTGMIFRSEDRVWKLEVDDSNPALQRWPIRLEAPTCRVGQDLVVRMAFERKKPPESVCICFAGLEHDPFKDQDQGE